MYSIIFCTSYEKRVDIMKAKKRYDFERIEMLRKDRNLTQTEIAKMLSISQRSYSHYEIGDVNIPLDILCKLARIHNTSIDYLLNLTDETKPYPPKKSS